MGSPHTPWATHRDSIQNDCQWCQHGGRHGSRRSAAILHTPVAVRAARLVPCMVVRSRSRWVSTIHEQGRDQSRRQAITCLGGGTRCCPFVRSCVIMSSWITIHGEVTLVVRSAVSLTAVENLHVASMVVSPLVLASLESLVLLTGTPGRSGNARKNPFGRFLFLGLDRRAETGSLPVGELARSPEDQAISDRDNRGSVLPC